MVDWGEGIEPHYRIGGVKMETLGLSGESTPKRGRGLPFLAF